MLNSVLLIGELIDAPKKATTCSGDPCCVMLVRIVRDRRPGGEVRTDRRIEDADGFALTVVAHRGLGRICLQELGAGRRILVSGRIEKRVKDLPAPLPAQGATIVARQIQLLNR